MPLNNKQMLPDRTRNMRQMQDVLQAEDVLLTLIEQEIDGVYKKASLLHKELINERWLEKKLAELTGGNVQIGKENGVLLVEITLNTGKIKVLREEEIISFINKWLPAHLAYHVTCKKDMWGEYAFFCLWQNDEIMTLREVRL